MSSLSLVLMHGSYQYLVVEDVPQTTEPIPAEPTIEERVALMEEAVSLIAEVVL